MEIRDPAIAVAASLCWLSRWRGGLGAAAARSASVRHGTECGFCELPPDALVDALGEFIKWSGLQEENWHDPWDPPVTTVRHEVESFMALPEDHQRALVARRQGYTDEKNDHRGRD